MVAIGLMLAIGLMSVGSPASAAPVTDDYVVADHARAQTSLPSARPTRPPINPVEDDGNVVVPGDAVTTDLPASGVGTTNPTDVFRDWTLIAVALLALNAAVLAGLAVRSFVQRRD